MEIDVQPYLDKLNRLSEYMDYRLSRLALNEWTILRIIFDKPLERKKRGGLFKPDPPVEFQVEYMEFTTERWFEHPMKGWGTRPDERMHMIGEDIEVWRLHKNEPVLTFEQWILKTN